MLVDNTITSYLDKAAAGTAVPGGGSVAALNAALAAGLTEMVANLTLGKKGYEAVEDEMKTIVEKASRLRTKLTASIDQDADAYTEVMAAYKLPKTTDEETAVRKQKIQEAIKHAALVPWILRDHHPEPIKYLAYLGSLSDNWILAESNSRTGS